MHSKKAFDPGLIRLLEIKMLPSPKGRDKQDSPKVALSRDEQLLYADYLEQTGQPMGAAFFRK